MKVDIRQYDLLMQEISTEINRGNEKHGHGPLATPIETIAILSEELGEYSKEVLKKNQESSRKELLQIAAVAINHLIGTGPHYSSL